MAERTEIIDTPENRYVKYFLEELRLAGAVARGQSRAAGQTRRRARRGAGFSSCRSCSRMMICSAF